VTLAEKAKITVPTLRDIETGKRKPNFQTIQKIAQALGVAPEELMPSPGSTDGQIAKHDRVEFPLETRRHPLADNERFSRPAALDEHVPGIRRALLHFSAMDRGHQNADRAAKLPSLSEIRYAVDAAYHLRQASQYCKLGASVPAFLIAAQLAAREYRDEQQRIAFGLLAEANHVAAAFLKKAGRHELAWIAVDRGVLAAEQAE
jgi:transcriptional regulator with XRE-family HTH domain